MVVTEMFFALEVGDMARATAFYASTFDATISFASPIWSSLHVAGVRLGLSHRAHGPVRTGLHFAVHDLAATLASIETAGGTVSTAPHAVAPGVVIAEASDPDGNGFTLRQA